MPDGLTGSLAQWPLPDLLNMLGSSKQTGRVELTNGPDRADLYLRDGTLCHAVMGARGGEPVLAAVMAWDKGTFSFEPRVISPEVTISRPLDEILGEARRAAAERESIRKLVPSSAAAPRLARGAPKEAITLQPAEWQLIASIDGKASVSEIAALLRADELAVSRMLYRFAADGLIGFDQAAAPAVQKPVVKATVHPAFFQQLQSVSAASLGPIAVLVIDDALEAVGSTRENLPRDAVTKVVELVANEIRDDAHRVQFSQVMLQWIRAQAA
jgi:Domain of unknown function (DUF4388)